MSTIAQSAQKIDRDHSRPAWTSRCTCTHIGGVHTNVDGNNLEGACLRCDCGKFARRP